MNPESDSSMGIKASLVEFGQPADSRFAQSNNFNCCTVPAETDLKNGDINNDPGLHCDRNVALYQPPKTEN